MIKEIISLIKNKVNSNCDLEIKVFERDFTLKLKVPESYKRPRKPRACSKRGKISRLTRKSVSRLKFFARNLPASFRYMATLTYPSEFPCDGRVAKRHLDLFLKCFKRKYPNRNYFQTLEFQDRGAPHFHILFDCPINAVWASKTWHRIVGSEDIHHLTFGCRVDVIKKNVASYLSDYIKKMDQKTVPEEYIEVGRFWSCSKNIIQSFCNILPFLPTKFVLDKLRTLKRYYKKRMKSYVSLKNPHGIKYKTRCVSSFKFNDCNDFLVNTFWPYFLNCLKLELGIVI